VVAGCIGFRDLFSDPWAAKFPRAIRSATNATTHHVFGQLIFSRPRQKRTSKTRFVKTDKLSVIVTVFACTLNVTVRACILFVHMASQHQRGVAHSVNPEGQKEGRCMR
jgi:hypothetical protein